MNYKTKILFLLMFVNTLFSYGQSEILIKGHITNSKTKDPITYASVVIPSQKRGTITDSVGNFTLSIKEIYPRDSLEVTYLGYHNFKIPLKENLSFLNISLKEQLLNLDEVQVTEYGPLYYLKQALKSSPENYNEKPYYIVSYFENILYENKKILSGSETIFKTYYQDKIFPEEPHQVNQIMLFKKIETSHKLEFMRKQVMKKVKKINNKGDTKDIKLNLNLTPLYIPIHHRSLPFLNQKYFKKFKYSIRERCVNRGLIIIDFITKHRFSFKYTSFKGSGTIYIDCENYAIIKLEMNFDFEPSFLAKTAFFIALNKLKVNQGTIKGSIEYSKSKEDGFWYPKALNLLCKVNTTKVHWFSKNDHAIFEFISNTLVNQIIKDDVTEIPKEKQFSFSELNLQNDINISWDDVISVKSQLYQISLE